MIWTKIHLKIQFKRFCFKRASLFFSTASSSYMLHSMATEPLTFLVIDEAAQLKESESIIPLQLSGIKHAVLFGDERQLPAMVESKVSGEACFGRSLFERLSRLRHPKHLLCIQYRMHPFISLFPNSYFYDNKICDSSSVRKRSYEKRFLPGPMYGPYSLINVFGGGEEFIKHSCRNMVEVSAVMKILLKLYKAWIHSKEKLSIGIVSPYRAQVVAIQEKLGSKYEKSVGFAVKVMSIDGFQGGEEDIIIISTVRSNNGGSIGFICNPKRANVARKRARHCLWILGNERTLSRNKSVWKALVLDAKARQCFFNADDDTDLGKAILDMKIQLVELDELLNLGSILFKGQRWKVNFSDNFLKSLRKLTSLSNSRLKDSILFAQLTVKDVEESQYIQVLKFWDILTLEHVQKRVTHLDNMFVKYTDEYINLCKEKCIEGNLEVPKTWGATPIIGRFKNLARNERRQKA